MLISQVQKFHSAQAASMLIACLFFLTWLPQPCLLFFVNMISVLITQFGTCYHWKSY
jgi:hypothetical protein